jgi:hypothetical protein
MDDDRKPISIVLGTLIVAGLAFVGSLIVYPLETGASLTNANVYWLLGRSSLVFILGVGVFLSVRIVQALFKRRNNLAIWFSIFVVLALWAGNIFVLTNPPQ